MAYASFEDRYRPEATVRARQEVYREHLAAAAGWSTWAAAGASCLSCCARRASPPTASTSSRTSSSLGARRAWRSSEDAVAHLEGLEPGDVDGIVASHVIEHLPHELSAGWSRGAAEALARGRGLLIWRRRTRSPSSAGSVNFHRDPTHLDPSTPTPSRSSARAPASRTRDTAALPGARRRAPAAAGPGRGPLAEHVDAVVEQLNELVYG